MTAKQQLFCDEYLIDMNATQAAIRACYSEKSAYSIGQENLTKPEIQEYIQKRLAEKEDALIAKQDEVLKTLTRILRREESETVVVTCKTHKSSFDENGKKIINDTEEPIIVDIPSKLSNVNRAAEMLGKYYTLFTEKIDSDEPPSPIPVTIPAALIGKSFVDVYRSISDEEYGEYVLKGGRGSTKSSFVALAIIERLLNHPEEHALALRQVGDTLKDSVYSKLCWAISALGVDNEFQCKLSPLEIVRKSTKQKIYFRGCDDPGKLKSLSPSFGHIAVLWFEELDQFHGDEAVRNVEQTVIRGGDTSLIFKSFNPPQSRSNWANKYCLLDKPGRLVHHSIYLDVPRKWLGKRFIDDAEFLKELNPKAYEHEYLGEATGTGGAVFENLTIRDITDDETSRFDRVYNGIDWGWYPDPFRLLRCAFVASERRPYIFAEAGGNKLKNEVITGIINDMGISKADKITADSGGEGPKSIDWFRGEGYLMRGAVKGPGSVEYSMKWLCSLTEIIIDGRRCPNATREFSEYEYERDKDGEFISGYPDKDNHCIDAVRYATEDIWRRRG